jgi:tetratricopeptide (TPR) repeat protein
MENQFDLNQQTVSGGQGMQVNHPQAPVIQATSSTVNITYQSAPQLEAEITTTPQNLPYSGVIAFVGREQELEQIHGQLQARSTVAISAIAGMGGIGKTELALQYALKQCREGFYSGGICWVRAREEAGTQIISFARSLLNLTPPDDLELAEKVCWCWGRWREGETLLVLDDVQDYGDVRSFLPPQDSRFKVLMTSRSRFGSPVQELQLDVLSEVEALELLRSLVQNDRVDQQLEQAKQLCEWLGYLPLGVELVGRYLFKKRDLSIAGLWQRLQEQRLAARAFKQAEPGMTASLGVAAAFELSWQSLAASAQQVAAVLSLFALVEIPWTLVEQCLSEVDAEELEEIRDQVLIGESLLKRVDQGMYQLHQLLREFFASKREQRADGSELQRKFYEVLIAEAERVTKKPERSLFEESTIVIAHLQATIDFLSTLEKELDLAQSLFWIAGLYVEQGNYEHAKFLYEQVLKIQTKQLGEFHSSIASSLNNLAFLNNLKGHYSEAECLYKKSLEIRQKLLGNEHLDVAISLNNLAELYDDQGRYSEAEHLYKKSLEIRRKLLGNEHSDVAHSLNNLALLYNWQGRYEEAESLYKKSLKISQRQLGSNHLLVGSIFNNLGLLYYSQGRYEEAESFYEMSLKIRQQHLSGNHPEIARTFNNLAEVYRLQGRYSEAEPLYEMSLKIRQFHFNHHHVDVAQSFNNLALLYQAQERYNEAEIFFLHSLTIYQQQLGTTHPLVANSTKNRANLYQLQEHYKEAEPLYLQALLIAIAELGKEHPKTVQIKEHFRSLLQKVLQENRTDELSDDPMTRSLLQEIQNEAL